MSARKDDAVAIADNKRTLDEFDRLLGSDDLSALDRLCLPDMVNHALAPDRPAGLAGTRASFSRRWVGIR